MIKKIIFLLVCLAGLVFSTVWYCLYDDVVWWRLLISFGLFSFGSLLFMKEDLAVRMSLFLRLKKYKEEDVSDFWRFLIMMIVVILMIIGAFYLIVYNGTIFNLNK